MLDEIQRAGDVLENKDINGFFRSRIPKVPVIPYKVYVCTCLDACGVCIYMYMGVLGKTKSGRATPSKATRFDIFENRFDISTHSDMNKFGENKCIGFPVILQELAQKASWLFMECPLEQGAGQTGRTRL